MINTSWRQRDYEIVTALTCQVRVLALTHVRHVWARGKESLSAVRNDLIRLTDAGLIQQVGWNAELMRIGRTPLAKWAIDESAPDFEELIHVVRDRWTGTTRIVEAYVATPRAARLFGSAAGRVPPPNHRSHDLLLGTVYTQFQRTRPRDAQRWVGEDALPMAERGVKNPDAFLVDDNGEAVHVIESAGRYSREQLESFHRYCRESELSYELW